MHDLRSPREHEPVVRLAPVLARSGSRRTADSALPAHGWQATVTAPAPESPSATALAEGRQDSDHWTASAQQLPSTHAASAWSGSLWASARDGAAPGLAAGNGQLGGSQAGVRLYRRLAPGISLTGRVSSALATRQGEASLGVALRRGALALLAERRFALDHGGRNDWSVTATAGVADVVLPFDLRLDGYAQAGIVGHDGFADGALRLERTVAARGGNRIAIGAGSWGAIQPGIARLDVGPQVVAHMVLGGRALRVSAEWRQRVAGKAAPGSGPAITLGADF